MNNIIYKYKERAKRRTSPVLFDAGVAMEILLELEREKIPVHGVDGFRMFGEKIQPDQDRSIDLSNHKDCWSAAREFIGERMESGFAFEIVTPD